MRQAVSELHNWLEDENPMNLPAPPQAWLQKLHDFDDSLVVLPSRQMYCYRLAQRRTPDRKSHLVHHLAADSDSNMLARYGLVPVTSIIATCKWDNPVMWEDLRQRMPSRMGGAEQFEKQLLARERQVELDKLAERDDMTTIVAKDAKKFYDLKRGVRTTLWSPTIKGSEKPASQRSAAIRILNANGGKATITKI